MSTTTTPRTPGATSNDTIDGIGYGRQFGDWYHRLFPDDASVVAEVERLVALHPDPALGTVEFGVGTGRIALPLARRVGPVTGVDSSPEMLDVLRRDLTDDTPVEPVHGDICTYRPTVPWGSCTASARPCPCCSPPRSSSWRCVARPICSPPAAGW